MNLFHVKGSRKASSVVHPSIGSCVMLQPPLNLFIRIAHGEPRLVVARGSLHRREMQTNARAKAASLFVGALNILKMDEAT